MGPLAMMALVTLAWCPAFAYLERREAHHLSPAVTYTLLGFAVSLLLAMLAGAWLDRALALGCCHAG